jgi:hypothetical protein
MGTSVMPEDETIAVGIARPGCSFRGATTYDLLVKLRIPWAPGRLPSEIAEGNESAYHPFVQYEHNKRVRVPFYTSV